MQYMSVKIMLIAESLEVFSAKCRRDPFESFEIIAAFVASIQCTSYFRLHVGLEVCFFFVEPDHYFISSFYAGILNTF